MTTMTAHDPAVRLEVSRLAKTYNTPKGDVPVIADLTFDLRQGEIACIVGPSGIGKTTLLKCLAGLQPVSSGSVVIDGHTVDGPPEELALVFQEYSRSLMPWLTVLQNIELPLKHCLLYTSPSPRD